MNILKFLNVKNWSFYGTLVSLLCLFHLVANLIWINLNKLPLPWDQAGHTIIAFKFADFFLGKGDYSFLTISDYYPPLTHIIVAFLMLIFGRESNIGPLTVTGFFIVSIIFLYLYAKELFKDRQIAFVAALFYSFLPFVDNLSRYFLLEIPLVAATLATLYFLEKSEYFSVKKYVYLFAFSAGCALLIKWAAAFYLALPVLIKFHEIYKQSLTAEAVKLEADYKSALKNIFTAGVLILLMNFLWYTSNLDVILNSLKITSTAEESDPGTLLSIDNFIFYFHHMFNFQLTWLGMLVFLFSIPGFLISEKKKSLVLLLNILSIYLIFSLIGNKDLRYIIILAPLSSIVVSFGIIKFFGFEKLLAIIVNGILVVYYLVYFFSLGFGFPIDPITANTRKTVFIPVLGGIDLINLASDSSFLLAPKFSQTIWPNLTIADEMSRHDQSKKIKILIIAEKPFFNQVNMELARRQLNKDKIEFFAPYSLGPLKDSEIEGYLNDYSVVLVADNDLGPRGGIRHIARMRQLKEYLEKGNSTISQKINSYGLPDGDFLSVYKIQQWPSKTIVEELSKHNPLKDIKILVLSSKPQVNGENLENLRKEMNKEKISFFKAAAKNNYSDYDLVLVSEKEAAKRDPLENIATKINTYYLPDGDKLYVYKISQ